MEHLIAAAIEEIDGGDGDFDFYRATSSSMADVENEEDEYEEVDVGIPPSSSRRVDDDSPRLDRPHDDRPSSPAASTSPTNDVAPDGGDGDAPSSWIESQRRRYGPYRSHVVDDGGGGGGGMVRGGRMMVRMGIAHHRIRQLDSIGIDWSGRCVARRRSVDDGRRSGEEEEEEEEEEVEENDHEDEDEHDDDDSGDDAVRRPRRQKKKTKSRGSPIAREFDNGRTDNDVKNRWASLERSRKRRRMVGRSERGDWMETASRRGGGTDEDEEDWDEATRDDGDEKNEDVDEKEDAEEEREDGGDENDCVAVGDDELDEERGKSIKGGRPRGRSSEAAVWTPGTNLGRRTFPETLFKLVDECTSFEPHVLGWVPDGTAFEVRDVDLLPNILRRYFRHGNYSSLARMLYLYGFKKYNSGGWKGPGTFQHPHFARSSTRESLVALVTKDGIATPTTPAPSSADPPSRTFSLTMRGEKSTASLRPADDAQNPRSGGPGCDVPGLIPSVEAGVVGSDALGGHASSSTKLDHSGASHPWLLFDFPTNAPIFSSRLSIDEVRTSAQHANTLSGDPHLESTRPPDGKNESDDDARDIRVKLAPPLTELAPGQCPHWNLGAYATISNVQYFKSDIGKYWIEQIVPRKTLKAGGPPSDKYFLSPSGLRFRSMLEVNRYLVSCDSKSKEEYDDKDLSICENDGEVGSIASDSEEERSKPWGHEDDQLNPCMCKKSRCLKLYCECFNKGRFCTADCYCVNCRNKPRHDAERSIAVNEILIRNPDAFKPRAKTTIECKCRRSACLKKYCDCFSHGVYCSATCRCKGCENVDPEKVVVRKRAKRESDRRYQIAQAPSVQASDDIVSNIDAMGGAAAGVKSEWKPSEKKDASMNNLNNASESTFHCPKCSKILHFAFAKTASASFSRHLKACGRDRETSGSTNVIKGVKEARVTSERVLRAARMVAPPNATPSPSEAEEGCRRQKSVMAPDRT
ncbi:hypothetical protein ACHAXA_009924, partial [Cyclostephanos tholiformis]